MAEPYETDRGDQANVAGTEKEQVHEAGSPASPDVRALPKR
jgi:hypothetical protein